MDKKEHRNMYKVSVADYLLFILQKFNVIIKKLSNIVDENKK